MSDPLSLVYKWVRVGEPHRFGGLIGKCVSLSSADGSEYLPNVWLPRLQRFSRIPPDRLEVVDDPRPSRLGPA